MMPPSADSLTELGGVRVALVHDYLNQPGGAEKVVEVFAEMFPSAPIFTSVYDENVMPPLWREKDIRTSFMQRLSPRLGLAKALFPLYPFAFESFDLSEYDLVLSSSTTFAKGAITRPGTLHVNYCNNTTRFLWMEHEYLRYERLPPGARTLLPWMATPLRVWDFSAAQRVDRFIAGSRTAARRIAKWYRRESVVVESPIDASRFTPVSERAAYFLVVSRLQSYKRIDVAIRACSSLGLPLHVIGDGPDRSRLERLAGEGITFFGRVSDAEVRGQMARCRALILPGEEDFGLTPLEVQASGRPVIAYAAGGALETVVDGETGLFFREQTAESLAGVLARFDDGFDAQVMRRHAMQFDKSVFKRRMFDLLAEWLRTM